jgi:peptidoglycan/LPS O-acetylase OafA/YrhL
MGPRKYFLDWLRVLAFALLILFHVGCLYASWDYNLKSPHILPGIDWVLLAIHPWRMALLFLISGVASRHLLAKLGAGGLALDRIWRILPPLLFGMFVVIPPETWVELVAKGVTRESYLRFWVFDYLRADQTLVAPLHKTMPTYDHLWFLAYLLAYALNFALLAGVWRLAARLFGAGAQESAPVVPLGVLLVGPGLWLVATQFLIERVAPETNWVGNDWGSHLKWGGMFLTGVLAAGRPDVWAWTRRWRGALAMAALLFLALQSLNRAWWLTGLADPFWSAAGWSIASGLFAWTTIGALLGLAGRHLDRASPWLSHLNEAILPVYVLHQPILLVAAFVLMPLGLPFAQEAALIAAITLVGALAIYEVAIRPFAVTRVLFGLKLKRRGPPPSLSQPSPEEPGESRSTADSRC